MELTFENTTHIGLGHATQADAFQCGREAAQMAKSQIPSHAGDMVVVFCPSGVHFKDFIEGARLVTGEDKLLGLPVDWIITNDLPSLDACVVLVLQLSSVHFTLASSKDEPVGLDSDITSLLTQCRQGRGNAQNLYEHHGILMFENREENDKENLATLLTADAGLNTWIVGGAPCSSAGNPIICRNQTIGEGLAGIEFFSSTPFGIGSVGTGAFSQRIEILREAARSSVRDAMAQMNDQKPAMGFVFCDFADTSVSRDELSDIFRLLCTTVHNIPLVMVPVRHPFSRSSSRSTTIQKGSVITLLVPR